MADDSSLSNVGSRYAQALFDLATEQNQVAAVEADLKSLKAAIADSKDLRTLLGSPAFGSEDKAKGLVALGTKAKFSLTTLKFLGLLASNGRAAALSAVIDGYAKLSAAARGAVSAEVTTALPLSAAQAKGVA
ncbi:MAG: ATP synthase F1 subunit delta, partial [Phenylobacterium sp.]|nr:ATP synthase F1 subunit delta [Phenylobacterium sp.]